MNRSFVRFARKSHRFLVIPMVIFFLANVAFSSTQYQLPIKIVTSATMILLMITGVIMFINSKMVKNQKS